MRADQRDARQDVVDEVRGARAGPDAGDEAAILAHVVGDVVRAEDDRDIEVGEEDDAPPRRAARTRARRQRSASKMRLEARCVLCTKIRRWRTACGAERIEVAKMTGMTPPELTLSGRCVDWPPIMLRPTMRLAYCTGMRRSLRST